MIDASQSRARIPYWDVKLLKYKGMEADKTDRTEMSSRLYQFLLNKKMVATGGKSLEVIKL